MGITEIWQMPHDAFYCNLVIDKGGRIHWLQTPYFIKLSFPPLIWLMTLSFSIRMMSINRYHVFSAYYVSVLTNEGIVQEGVVTNLWFRGLVKAALNN